MKTRKMKYCLVFLFILSIMTIAGCVGSHTLNTVVIPTMKDLWKIDMKSWAANGGADVDVMDQFGQALTDKDRPTIVALWPAIKISIENDIEDDPEAVKIAKKERLIRFQSLVDKLINRVI